MQVVHLRQLTDRMAPLQLILNNLHPEGCRGCLRSLPLIVRKSGTTYFLSGIPGPLQTNGLAAERTRHKPRSPSCFQEGLRQ